MGLQQSMTIVLQFFPNGEFSQGVDTSSRRTKTPRRLIPAHSSSESAGIYVCKRTQKPLHPYRNYVCEDTQTSFIPFPITDADLDRCNEQYADIPSQTYAVEGFLFRGSDGTEFSILETSETATVLRVASGNRRGRDVHINTSIYSLVHIGMLSPLGLSDAPILTEPLHSRKKLLSMTRNMGRNLRNSVYILEETYGKEQLSFLTLTLPNLSREGLSSCCSHWDVMVNTFTKWLRTRVEYSLMELEYAYCTEIQPGRLQNRGEYAPHLHIVFRGKAFRKQRWAVSWLDCRNAWAAIIGKFVDEPFDTRALENIQRIKKSAARYLSKYLSKGKQTIPASGDDEAPIQQLHTQWGGMSRNLSRQVKKRVVRFTQASGLDVIAFDMIRNMNLLISSGLVSYFSRRFISLGISRSTGAEVGLHVGVGAFPQPTHISLPLCLQYISALQT